MGSPNLEILLAAIAMTTCAQHMAAFRQPVWIMRNQHAVRPFSPVTMRVGR